MASAVYVCAVVLLTVLFTICSATQIVKGLYCIDPDTGKLYPVNTTWQSQSFCGNYTCKMRKKNVTETLYMPIRQINISKYKKHNEDSENDMTISPSENSIVVSEEADNAKQPIFQKDFAKTNDIDPMFANKDLKEGDRYLTENEIKTITEMLHTIKKSDLEAIVDIYNLAQDIYKDIDDEGTEKLVKDTIMSRKLDKLKDSDHRRSYWYEPIQFHNKEIDMSHEGTNLKSTKKPPSNLNPTYFKSSLIDKDFGKIPYYYPISNFQRLSSYIHPRPSSYDLEKAATETKPCSKPGNKHNLVAMPWYTRPVKNPDSQPMMRSSTLLPIPFSYIYHYNVSRFPSNYYYNYPYAYVNYRRDTNYPNPFYGPYTGQNSTYATYGKIDSSPKEESFESNYIESKLLDQLLKTPTAKKILPEWQTEPLSEKVLDEVRAHMKDKPTLLNPTLFNRNIKLEKVAKVIKLDELTRKRREVENYDTELDETGSNEQVFEAYIESTTCKENTEVGYFSMGNITQPYPACCPQKITNLHST